MYIIQLNLTPYIYAQIIVSYEISFPDIAQEKMGRSGGDPKELPADLDKAREMQV